MDPDEQKRIGTLREIYNNENLGYQRGDAPYGTDGRCPTREMLAPYYCRIKKDILMSTNWQYKQLVKYTDVEGLSNVKEPQDSQTTGSSDDPNFFIIIDGLDTYNYSEYDTFYHTGASDTDDFPGYIVYGLFQDDSGIPVEGDVPGPFELAKNVLRCYGDPIIMIDSKNHTPEEYGKLVLKWVGQNANGTPTLYQARYTDIMISGATLGTDYLPTGCKRYVFQEVHTNGGDTIFNICYYEGFQLNLYKTFTGVVIEVNEENIYSHWDDINYLSQSGINIFSFGICESEFNDAGDFILNRDAEYCGSAEGLCEELFMLVPSTYPHIQHIGNRFIETIQDELPSGLPSNYQTPNSLGFYYYNYYSDIWHRFHTADWHNALDVDRFNMRFRDEQDEQDEQDIILNYGFSNGASLYNLTTETGELMIKYTFTGDYRLDEIYREGIEQGLEQGNKSDAIAWILERIDEYGGDNYFYVSDENFLKNIEGVISEGNGYSLAPFNQDEEIRQKIGPAISYEDIAVEHDYFHPFGSNGEYLKDPWGGGTYYKAFCFSGFDFNDGGSSMSGEWRTSTPGLIVFRANRELIGETALTQDTVIPLPFLTIPLNVGEYVQTPNLNSTIIEK